MGQEYTLVVLLAWFPQAISQLLGWIYWWQVKEYRFDRFKVFLTSRDGMRSLGLLFIIAKFLVLLISYFWGNFLLLFALLLFLDGKLLFEVVQRRLRRPIFTLRAAELFLTGILFILLTILFVFGGFSDFAGVLAFGEVGLVGAPIVGILWTAPLVFLSKVGAIKQARGRLAKVGPVVVGVAGSYGKTTTKEFIAQLLATRYKTAKTLRHENTEFGVARAAAQIAADTQFFVVEMGAYKKGEIKKLADIVRPSVGVITGIEPQHAALFGSLSEIRRTKYELIKSLPEGGLSVFNWTNSYCRQLAKLARKRWKVAKYGNARILSATAEGVAFEFSGRKLFAGVHGIHFVQNATAAIVVARHFGVTWLQIKEGLRQLRIPERTMTVVRVGNGLVVDDSYNATPAGAGAAVKYLALFPDKKKVVISPGIIELGQYSDQIHQDLGRLAARVVDEMILTSDDFAQPIKKGFGGNALKVSVVDDVDALFSKMNSLLREGAVVLLEGRTPLLRRKI